jgi:PDZ domain-containing protein
MARTTWRTEDRAARAVMDCLADILAIEAQILASVDDWAAALRDHPEAAAMVERLRSVARSHHETWAGRLAASTPRRSSRASRRIGSATTPASAQATIRQVAEVALDAALEGERAYQTARLSGDGDTCDLLESHLSDHAATVAEARHVLPLVVARELRAAGLPCACRCPMCSIGACGCVRATLAASELAWTGEEPPRTAGLILHSPPRPGSQLAAAGLDEGDVIVSVDGDEVGVNREAQAALRRHDVGDEVRIEVDRVGGLRTDITVRRVG